MRLPFRLLAAALAFTPLPAAAQAAAPQLQPWQAQAREILSRLVSFRTAEGQGPQMTAMVDYMTGLLRENGVPEADIARVPHGATMGLLVRIPGRAASEGPILFLSHMDVVDARPEDWSRSPFTMVEENGRFYGRGVADNKAGVAAMLSTILRLRAAGRQPERTLVFAFSGDEETSGETAQQLARHAWVANARYALNTDAGGGGLSENGARPLAYFVQGAEKTYATYRITLTNPGGHSSTPRDDNAIYDLARVLEGIEAYRFPVTSNVLTRQFAATMGPLLPAPVGPALTRFAANPNDAEAAEVLRRTPEFIGLTRTTCIATRLDAGHADNALPQRATATINCRIFPGTSAAQVRDTLQEVAGSIPRVEIADQTPEGPVSEPIPEVMAAITRSVHARTPGVPISMVQESGATDGLWFRSAGIPTFGTSGGFVVPGTTFAHGLNETVPVAAFYAGADHIHDLAIDLGHVAGGTRRR